MPELELCASTLNVDPVNVTLVVSLLASLEGDNPNEVGSAMEASKFGFIREAVTCRGDGGRELDSNG